MNIRPLNTKGAKHGTGIVVVLVFLIAVVAILGTLYFSGTKNTEFGDKKNDQPVVTGTCSEPSSSTLGFTANISVQNSLNLTGTEYYATTLYLYESDADGTQGVPAGTVTSSSAVSLTAGKTYLVKQIATSGAAGDGSLMLSTNYGQITQQGNLLFTACGTAKSMTVKVPQHGLWQTRAYDQLNKGLMYDNTSSSSGAYVTQNNVNFTSTSANTTASAVAAGGEVHVTQYIRPNVDDETLNDRGIYVLVDASTTVWNIPTIKLGSAGAVAQNVKSQLTGDEAAAYSNYEYVYKIDASQGITQQSELPVDIDIFALAGVNPVGGDSIVVAYAPIGQFVSTSDSSILKVGAVQDNSAKSAVNTLQTATLAVS